MRALNQYFGWNASTIDWIMQYMCVCVYVTLAKHHLLIVSNKNKLWIYPQSNVMQHYKQCTIWDFHSRLTHTLSTKYYLVAKIPAKYLCICEPFFFFFFYSILWKKNAQGLIFQYSLHSWRILTQQRTHT